MSVILPKTLLPQLSAELRKELENNGYLKHFATGEIMLKENSRVNIIPLVISGALKIMREETDGREILLYYIQPGESCIMSVFAGLYNSPSKIRAIADKETEVLMFPVNKANEWIKKYPEWIDFILALYYKRFEELLHVVNDVAFQRIDERILNWLRKKSQLTDSLIVSTTHQQIADELGTSREVVSRLLKQMEKDDRISLTRNKITLK